MRVFITGGTGLIGRRLCAALRQRGDEPVVLTRHPQVALAGIGPAAQFVEGDPSRIGPWMEAVDGCQAVVNLAGANLFDRRWNEDFKRQLRESRVLSTQNLVDAIRQAKARPNVLVSGSAIGYYGFTGDELLTEDSPAGTGDFLSQLTPLWEEAALPAEEAGARVVLLRTGVVLDKAGGALKQMMTPFKFFIGGPVGHGRQWVSWIHHADEVGLILFAMDEPKVRGPLNATAPEPVTNRQLAKALGKAMGRPSFAPVPAFALKLRFGEVANVVIKGQRVIPKKAQDLGYRFQFPDVDAALRDIMAKPALVP